MGYLRGPPNVARCYPPGKRTAIRSSACAGLPAKERMRQNSRAERGLRPKGLGCGETDLVAQTTWVMQGEDGKTTLARLLKLLLGAGKGYSGFVRMLFFDHATMHLIIGPMCNIQICQVIRELRARNITCDSPRDVYFFSSL